MNRISLTILYFSMTLTSCIDHSKSGEHVKHGINAEKELRSELNNISITYSIGAKPDSISFKSDNTAVIVVDMQNDFGTEGGLLDYLDVDISEIQKVVEPTKKVIDASRDTDIGLTLGMNIFERKIKITNP